MKPHGTFTLGLVVLTLVAGQAVEAQRQSGSCPLYASSILFTPEVMVDIIDRGDLYLTVAAGVVEDDSVNCQTLSFHKQQTWSFSYRDSEGNKQVKSGIYKVEFPTFIEPGAINMEGLSSNLLGSDRRGNLKLVPIAYSPGIIAFASCSEFLWTHTQMLFLFMDDSVDLTPVNYSQLVMELTVNKLFPDTLEHHLPDQTCATCPRPKGKCRQKNLPGYFSAHTARALEEN